MVRQHPLQPAQRQVLRGHRHHHAAAARGRPRRPRARAGAMGGGVLSGDRGSRGGARDRDDLGAAALHPAAGEALHPAREPLATLEHIRRTIGEYNFAGQYQQSPAPLGGGMVKEAWFKRYSENERPESFERVVQSWDTANKATELSDFSVCTTWGIRGKDLYLLNALRKRLEYPALKRAVREQQNLFNATEVLIEDKASGTQLIQELIADGCYGLARYQPMMA